MFYAMFSLESISAVKCFDFLGMLHVSLCCSLTIEYMAVVKLEPRGGALIFVGAGRSHGLG